MPDAVSLAGVVLAGGESRRMGRDKATLPAPGGTGTLAEYVTGIVAQRCDPVFVVAAPGQPIPQLQAHVIRDEIQGLGPLPATGLGLRAAGEAGARYAFVCAVDMPLRAPAASASATTIPITSALRRSGASGLNSVSTKITSRPLRITPT